VYHNLRAAQGFIELGDPDSAWEELEVIPAEDRAHPVALRLRVYIYREKKRWMEMAEISRHLTEIEPQQAEHWTNRAWAERRHLGIPVAEKTLLHALKHFPNEGIIYYNLACYSAVDGRTLEAKSLLGKAIELDPEFKELALDDEDLKGIW
jgi:tetratricopeptide (TPR) repeat protein